jgi:hypothetical protein
MIGRNVYHTSTCCKTNRGASGSAGAASPVHAPALTVPLNVVSEPLEQHVTGFPPASKATPTDGLQTCTVAFRAEATFKSVYAVSLTKQFAL